MTNEEDALAAVLAKVGALPGEADFFDVATYPTITFKSKNMNHTGADSGDIVGDMAMHGVTKEIVLYIEVPRQRQGNGGQSDQRLAGDARADQAKRVPPDLEQGSRGNRGGG